VFWLVMGTGQRLAIAGLLLGLAGAYAGGRLVANQVYAMHAADPVILPMAAVIVAVIVLPATMIPAVRASRLDPARALRAE
jgi:putative ABC transport system permease protein